MPKEDGAASTNSCRSAMTHDPKATLQSTTPCDGKVADADDNCSNVPSCVAVTKVLIGSAALGVSGTVTAAGVDYVFGDDPHGH